MPESIPGVSLSSKCQWTLAQWHAALPTKEMRDDAFAALKQLETNDTAEWVIQPDPGDTDTVPLPLPPPLLPL